MQIKVPNLSANDKARLMLGTEAAALIKNENLAVPSDEATENEWLLYYFKAAQIISKRLKGT